MPTRWEYIGGEMIVTKQKPFEDILKYLKNDKKIFIVGCTQCATVCKTGGEEDVAKMKESLVGAGKEVTGTVILDPPCYLLEVKKKYQESKDAILNSDSILVMACGDGVQTVREGMKKEVHPALDTLFLGERTRGTVFNETCSLCSECVLDETGGICPITICSKGLLNGPCGGTNKGKCEVDPDKDCAWTLIYNRLNELGQLDKMRQAKKPKDYSKLLRPRSVDVSIKEESSKK